MPPMKEAVGDLSNFARSGKCDVVIFPTTAKTADLGNIRLATPQSGTNGHNFIIVEAAIIHSCTNADHVDTTALYKAFKCIRSRFSDLRMAYPQIGMGMPGPTWPTIAKFINSALYCCDHTVVYPPPPPPPPPTTTTDDGHVTCPGCDCIDVDCQCSESEGSSFDESEKLPDDVSEEEESENCCPGKKCCHNNVVNINIGNACEPCKQSKCSVHVKVKCAKSCTKTCCTRVCKPPTEHSRPPSIKCPKPKCKVYCTPPPPPPPPPPPSTRVCTIKCSTKPKCRCTHRHSAPPAPPPPPPSAPPSSCPQRICRSRCPSRKSQPPPPPPPSTKPSTHRHRHSTTKITVTCTTCKKWCCDCPSKKKVSAPPPPPTVIDYPGSVKCGTVSSNALSCIKTACQPRSNCGAPSAPMPPPPSSTKKTICLTDSVTSSATTGSTDCSSCVEPSSSSSCDCSECMSESGSHSSCSSNSSCSCCKNGGASSSSTCTTSESTTPPTSSCSSEEDVCPPPKKCTSVPTSVPKSASCKSCGGPCEGGGGKCTTCIKISGKCNVNVKVCATGSQKCNMPRIRVKKVACHRK